MRKIINVILLLIIGLGIGAFIGKKYYAYKEYKNHKAWQKLNFILGEINNNYVDSVNIPKCTDAALTAVLSSLDPHSSYLPAKLKKRADDYLRGNFYGIGIRFNVINDTARVLDVIAKGPAAQAGMLKGDKILKIDSKSVAGKKIPIDSFPLMIKGALNTKVKLLLKRGNDTLSLKISRGLIPDISVFAAYMMNDSVAYVSIAKFSMNTYKEFKKATDTLLKQGMKDMILDLRDNSGGIFSNAILIANDFLAKGDTIVYTKGLHFKRSDFVADGKGDLQKIALKILINENSASASEILAGAIQDNDRGEIIGRRSFGKGLVQEPIDFSDGSGIRLTIARFYSPSGRCIQKPYGSDYRYELYERYSDGEMFNKDSIKINNHKIFKTKHGRKVYAGGGIIPDIYIPLDTANITKFWILCNRKALMARYASTVFDKHLKQLANIDNMEDLNKFLDALDIPKNFLLFVNSQLGTHYTSKDYPREKKLFFGQIRAIIAQYSKLSDEARYRIMQDYDPMILRALNTPWTLLVK